MINPISKGVGPKGFGLQNVESPIQGVTLESLIPKVKQKMPGAFGCPVDLNPFVWAFRQSQIAFYLVKFSPSRSQPGESTLSAKPTLIISGAEAITKTRNESQPSFVLSTELRKLERVQKKRDDNITTLDSDSRIRCIRLGVPPLIELSEGRQGISLNSTLLITSFIISIM